MLSGGYYQQVSIPYIGKGVVNNDVVFSKHHYSFNTLYR